MQSLWTLLLCGPNLIFLINVYHVSCFIPYPCLTSPLVWLPRLEGGSALSSPLCLNLVFPPHHTHTNCLFPFFFSYIFSNLFFSSSSPPTFLLVCCFSPTITSLHPSPHFVFSLFYSIVFPFTESSHVQGPNAAGCHHGVEVSIQFAGNACGSKHPPPSYHTCCGHCHLQPPICCQPMAQHRWWVELDALGSWYVQTCTYALVKKKKKKKWPCHMWYLPQQ